MQSITPNRSTSTNTRNISITADILSYPRPSPLFVNSVDFREFGVGAGEGTTCIQSNRFFLFSVFLCDFCVFRVMMRPSKRIPYMKPKYIQKFILKRKSMNPVNYRFTPPARKSEICSPTCFARLLASLSTCSASCLLKILHCKNRFPAVRPHINH